MPGPLFANNATATLASSYSTVATAITLVAGSGSAFPSPGAGEWFMATVVDNLNNIEIIQCTSRTADTLTVVRGQEGTSARALGAGEKLDNRLTAGSLEAIKTMATAVVDGSITGPKIAPLAITNGKIALGAVSTAQLFDGAVTNAKLGVGVALQNIGYTPVHQGGGVGQLTDTIFLGWTGAGKLALTVDSTDLGYILTERQDGSAGSAGYRGLPFNMQNGNYVIGLTDAGKAVGHNAAASVYYVPDDSTPFAAGATIQIVNFPGVGGVTITPVAGVTLVAVPGGAVGNRLLASPGICTIEKVAGSLWFIYGAGLS